MTLYNILKDIENYSLSHPYIKSYKFDIIDNNTAKNNQYPMVWNTLESTSLDDYIVSINIDCYFLDIIQQDRTNLQTILSNMLVVSQDLGTEFVEGYLKYGYNMELVKLEPVLFQFDDNVGGWKMTIKVDLRQDREKEF